MLHRAAIPLVTHSAASCLASGDLLVLHLKIDIFCHLSIFFLTSAKHFSPPFAVPPMHPIGDGVLPWSAAEQMPLGYDVPPSRSLSFRSGRRPRRPVSRGSTYRPVGRGPRAPPPGTHFSAGHMGPALQVHTPPKKNNATPLAGRCRQAMSSAAARRRARRSERATGLFFTAGRIATPSSRRQGGSMARTVRFCWA